MTAIGHEQPDRVPVDYWAQPEVGERLRSRLGLSDHESLLEHLGVDLRYVTGPSYAGLTLRSFDDGSEEDLWGVRRKSVTAEHGPYRWTYKHVVDSPLSRAESAEDVERYDRWPTADWWDYTAVAAECRAIGGHAVVNAGDRLDRTAQLKPMMYLRGMEQTYVDLIENPSIADATIARIRDYFLEYNRRVFDSAAGGIDVFMMGDDFGTQHGPMMDLATWRRFFRDGFRRFIDLAHSYDIRVMHHTCGSVASLIPEFIDAGLDILQSLQPRAAGMDLVALKREYGRDLAFHGSVDIQHVLPQGTPSAIRDHVARQMDAGKPGGGFIISTAHNIPPETPSENIVALYEAYREFGRY